MKNLIRVVFIFMLLNIPSAHAQSDYLRVRSMELTYMGWYSETFKPMDCQTLLSPLNNAMVGRIIILQDQEFFNRIQHALDGLQKIRAHEKPDVRIVLRIYYADNKVSTICVGNNRVLTIDGDVMNYSQDLVDLIRSAVPLSHLQ